MVLGRESIFSGLALRRRSAARVNPQPSWTLQPILDVTWELDLYGRLRRGVQAARADVEGSQAALDGVRVTVAAENTRAYADACSFAAAAAVQRRSIALAARGTQVVRTRQNAGAVSIFEVSRAESLEAQTRAALPGLEAQRAAALYRLRQGYRRRRS